MNLTLLIIIAIIIVFIFGAKRLPDIGKGLGGAIREFKNVKKELGEEGKPEESEPGNSVTREAGEG